MSVDGNKTGEGNTILELRNVEKVYHTEGVKTPVLHDINLTIDHGELVAITGPSGTGKSTLLNIMGCLDRPTAGTVLLEGTEITGLGDRELSRIRSSKIGFVFQLFHLLDRVSVMKNVLLPLVYTDDYPAQAEQRARRLLEDLGMGERLSFKPGALSGGQQQRVAIARALINEPALLLADEPTGNLDQRSGEEVLEIFERLHRRGHTIVMITHEPDVAARAQRVLRLADGTVTEAA